MNDEVDEPETATTDEGDVFDPRAAAALLAQAQERAQRQLDMRPPLLMLLAAVLVLVCYGELWLSVRDQQPYTGPSGTALVVLYAILAVWIAVVAIVVGRATSGVSGRSSSQKRAAVVTFATIYIFVYVFDGALSVAGAGPAIVFGIYPAAAPLVVVGAAAAAYEAGQEHWGWSAFALAVVALAAVAAYSGPVNVWGVIGVGVSLLLLARAASRIRHLQRAARAHTDGR